MGGGDLNQKKSWHPQTMKNQEKVWKAEQSKNKETERLNELKKEIDEERNREELRRIGESSGVLAKSDADKKVEWMYKSSTQLINREEYLLGRSIDKSFEILEEEEKKKEINCVGMKRPINHVEHECIPFSIRHYRNLESTEQVDLQRKVMEDPLMLIKQREMESRKKLLENPVKLKEIHRILKTQQHQLISKKNKKNKKSKKSKKNKKKKRDTSESSTSSSESEEDDLDTKLAKKYKKIKKDILRDGKGSEQLSLEKILEAKYETISKELDKAVEIRSKHKNRRRSSSSSGSERSKSRNRRRGQPEREPYRRLTSNRRSRSFSTERTFDKGRRRRSRSRSPISSRQQNRSFQKEQTIRSRSPPRMHKTAVREARKPKTNQLTEEEKEARIREMLENGKWREADRAKIVNKHRENYEREESQNKARDFDKNFINKEVKKAIANHSSIESRIRSNLNNIQRTKSSMDSNFARK